MNKKLLFLGIMAFALAFASCSKDDGNSANNPTDDTDSTTIFNYTNSWGNYACAVAQLLVSDASTLYEKWTTGGYASTFKIHNGNGYTSAEDCIQQILEGCKDISNEVGVSKIGGPYDSYKAGNIDEAIYSVESWYSWHSRDDYKNNILSIANSLVGKRLDTEAGPSAYDYKSIAAAVQSGTASYGNNIIEQCMKAGVVNKNTELMNAAIKVWTDVLAAWTAIDNIPQPFRSNIVCDESSAAIELCAQLATDLNTLEGKIAEDKTIDWQGTIDNYVDEIVLPTYKDLVAGNTNLYQKIVELQKNPSKNTFKAACDAWLSARAPWETSEAFLFGPVSELGLDPNMDSWPLDVTSITNTLNSQSWNESMNWSGDYDEDSEEIEAAQSVRGFHTLEYLLFINGKARTPIVK